MNNNHNKLDHYLPLLPLSNLHNRRCRNRSIRHQYSSRTSSRTSSRNNSQYRRR